MKKGIIMEINERFLTILTPEGEFLRAQKFNRPYQIGQEISFLPVEQAERKKYFSISILNRFKGKIVLTTGLAAMLVFLSIIPFYQNNQVYAYMSIDINPSIELGINKNYEVIELIPYNEDGKKIINQLDDWKQKDVHDVAREIIHEIKIQGYMKKNHEVVIATVYEEQTNDEDETRWNEEIEEIQAVLQNENLDLIVMEGTHEDREKAKEKGLTTGLYKENIANKNKVDSKKAEKSGTVPEKQEEQSTKANLQKQEEQSIKVKPQKQEEQSPKVRLEKQEDQSIKLNEQKQEDQSAKVKPQKQEEMPPKANSAKQNEKGEAKKDQSSHIPPGQLKKEEKTDKNVEKVGEVKKEQATPNEKEKINNVKENDGANHKEQKTNQNNSKNNSQQGKGQDSADKQLRAEEKEK